MSMYSKVLIEDTWVDYGDAEDIIQYCKDNNLEYIILTKQQILNMDNFFDYVFFCNTDIVYLKLQKLNCLHLCPDTYEMQYSNLFKRNIRLVKISDVTKMTYLSDFFIKPSDNNKIFDGFIIKSQNDIDNLKYIGDFYEQRVYISDVIKIDCEHRFLIGNGKCYANSYMKGNKINNYLEIIDVPELIKQTCDKFRCIDIGINMKSKEWFIIEINPPYSLDSYNIDIKNYMEFCIDACNYINIASQNLIKN